jgi:hypothetical protein
MSRIVHSVTLITIYVTSVTLVIVVIVSLWNWSQS